MVRTSDTGNALPGAPSVGGVAGGSPKPALYSGYEVWKSWDADAFGRFTPQDSLSRQVGA